MSVEEPKGVDALISETGSEIDSGELIDKFNSLKQKIEDSDLTQEEKQSRFQRLSQLQEWFFSHYTQSVKREKEIDNLLTEFSESLNFSDLTSKQVSPEQDEIIAEYEAAYKRIFESSFSVEEVGDKLRELNLLMVELFSQSAGSDDEQKIEDEIKNFANNNKNN